MQESAVTQNAEKTEDRRHLSRLSELGPKIREGPGRACPGNLVASAHGGRKGK